MAFNVNTDLVMGNDLHLFLVMPDTAGTISSAITDSEVLAYATSCELQIDAETIDTTSKLSCRWNSVRQGNASYTVNADALYALQSKMAAMSAYTVDDLFECLVNGKNIGWYMGQNSAECGATPVLDQTRPYYYGTAAITSLSITGGNNEVCSSSITLTGNGIINKGPNA